MTPGIDYHADCEAAVERRRDDTCHLVSIVQSQSAPDSFGGQISGPTPTVQLDEGRLCAAARFDGPRRADVGIERIAFLPRLSAS